MGKYTAYEYGPQGERIPASKLDAIDADPDLQPTNEFGRRLLQTLEAQLTPQPPQPAEYVAPAVLPSGVNPYRILCEAHSIADAEGLLAEGWKIVLEDDSVNAGTCTESTRTIMLSPRWMTSWEEARDTVIHEIAHACQTRHHGTAHDACLHELRQKHAL
jgi:hypothetical protein